MQPSFTILHQVTKYYGAADKGTPALRDGSNDRFLAFCNLSGAYNGNERHAEAVNDFKIIAHRTNTHEPLLEAADALLKNLSDGNYQTDFLDMDLVRALVVAVAKAKPDTGKYKNLGMTDAFAAEVQYDMNRK